MTDVERILLDALGLLSRLARHVADDRDTIGELAQANADLAARVAVLEAQVGVRPLAAV